MAFAISLADRWYLIYESAAKDQHWSNLSEFQSILEYIWLRLEDKAPFQADTIVRGKRLAASTPAKSARKARAAAMILLRAIECSDKPSGWESARSAALIAYEAVIDGESPHPLDAEANRAAWRQPGVQAEIGRQFALLQRVSAFPTLYRGAVQQLRSQSRSDTPELSHFMHAITLCSPDQLPAASKAIVEAVGKKGSSQGLASVMNSILTAPTSTDRLAPLRHLAALAAQSKEPSVGGLADMISAMAANFERVSSSVRSTAHPMDDGERAHRELLQKTLSSWEPVRICVFAALLAEQWLPAYESFAVQEKWARPKHLRDAIGAAWNHLLGSSLAMAEGTRLRRKLADAAPEDLDSPRVAAACEIVDCLVCCCTTKEPVEHALSAAEIAYQSLFMEVEQNDDGTTEQFGWQDIEVQKEVARQTKLLQFIGAIPSLDKPAIETLRQKGMPVV
jgi:uncharacterized protein YjaG (DUF416 family)